MVERVARALCRHYGVDPDEVHGSPIIDRWWEAYCDDARAAIAAMREPTEVMIAEGDDVSPTEIYPHEKASRLRYQAMIDAALK